MVFFSFHILDFLSDISVRYKRGVVKSSSIIVDLTNYRFIFVSFCFMHLNPVVKVHKHLGLVCQTLISLYCYLISYILLSHNIICFLSFPSVFHFSFPFLSFLWNS